MNSHLDDHEVSVREHILRDDVVDIIYSADWEIRGVLNDHVHDIDEHTMVDEDDVVTAIIKTVRENSR